ncbi:MAG: glycoside hydrolase family 78 protein, partial [Bacteroidales bacterium]|nr:glycoside hydrolase family 78 protein [Bacteroidales bacterium]
MHRLLILRLLFALSLLCFLFPQRAFPASSITPCDLRCEYMPYPLGLDVAVPRFGWTFLSDGRNQWQSACELIVGDSRKDVERLKGNMWESGKINNSRNIQVAYGGQPLKSFTRYFWRVRVYDRNGVASAWSAPAWFETAMLSPDDWSAVWIGDGKPQPANDKDFYRDDPAPVFRKIFETQKKVTAARLYLSGLGYCEASINGEKIGNRVLDPGWTAYHKQTPYVTCDVTGKVKKGKNVLCVMLGNGWYNPLPLRMWGRFNIRDALTVGRPCLKGELHIVYSDGSKDVIPTGEDWQVTPGAILRNSVYTGEHYDARREKNWGSPDENFDDIRNAVKAEGPAGTLVAQIQPPVKIIRVVKPVSVSEQPNQGVYLFDMGENFAGVARIRVKGPAGTRIVLRYGEDVKKDGSINVMTSVAGQIKSGNGGPGAPAIAWQEDSYTLKGGKEEIWAPRFTFHGFRYVEVTGWPGIPGLNSLEGLCLSADVEPAGEFSSSNDMFNRLFEVIHRTFRSNLFSVQSDCPAREKFGYGGDMICTANTFSFNYNMANFYRKVLRDNINDQRPSGAITETTPFVGIADFGTAPNDGSGPVSYQAGLPFLMKHMYDFYGDKSAIATHYDALHKLLQYLIAHSKNNLITIDISDHEALDKKPHELTAAAWYYYHAKLFADFARILGKDEDAQKYGALADNIRQAIITSMFDAATGKFHNATQSAQIFGLWFDFVEGKDREAAFDALMQAIAARNGHLSTGIFATKMMFDVFREADRNETAYRIANQRDFPGWGYMLENGATTLWETWAYSDNIFSQNHPMFGSIGEWFYRSLLGINPAGPGFEKITIKPQPAGDLTSAKGSYRSIRGLIAVEWLIDKGKFSLKVKIPVNVSAEVWLPSTDGGITESGKPVEQCSGVEKVKTDGKHTVLSVGSGEYYFL